MTETEPPLEEKIRHRFLLPYTPEDEKHLIDLIDVLEGRATIYRDGEIAIENFEDFTDLQKVVGYAVLCYYAARGSGRDAPEFDSDELKRQTGVSPDVVPMHAIKRIGEQYRLDFEEVAAARDILMEDYVDFRSNGSDERHRAT